MHAEEAVEIPSTTTINLNTSLTVDTSRATEQNDACKTNGIDQNEKYNERRQIFQKIGQQEFEDVVFTPERKIKKSRNRVTNGNENCSSVPDVDDLPALNKDQINANDAKTTHSSLLTLSIDDDFILKTDRNLESIQRDVENKEKLLADVLDFDLSKYMTSSQITATNPNVSQCIDTITYISCKTHSNDTSREEKDDDQEEYNEHSDHTETESGDDDVSYRTELKKLEDLGECRKKILRDKLNYPSLQSNYVDAKMPYTADMDRHELEVQFHSKCKLIGVPNYSYTFGLT